MDIAIEEVPFYLDPRGYHPRTWGRVVYSGAAHSDVVTGLTLAASRGAMPLGLRQIADYSDPSRRCLHFRRMVDPSYPECET